MVPDLRIGNRRTVSLDQQRRDARILQFGALLRHAIRAFQMQGHLRRVVSGRKRVVKRGPRKIRENCRIFEGSASDVHVKS